MSKDFELVVIDKAKGKCSTMPKFRVQPQKEESQYQCLSTTNREKPEKFMNATKKEETELVPREPELYMNIAHAKRGMHPSQTLPRMGTTNTTADTVEGAADVTPTPAVSSHRRAMEILKTYIKAEPVTRNAAGSDTESDSSDFTSPSTPQRSGRNNTYISKHPSTEMKSSGPYLKSDVCTQPAIHSVVAVGQSRNHPDTAPRDGDLQTLSTSSKKDEGKSSNKCLLFSIVVCCILVAFLLFTLLLTFVWLNRSELMKNQEEFFISTATSNMLIMNLTKQVRDLEESLNEMKMQTNAAITNLSIMLLANYTIQVQNSKASLRDLEERLSASIDLLDTANANLELMINDHVSKYSSHVYTSENNYSRLDARISDNYMNLDTRISGNYMSLDTRISGNYTNLQSLVYTKSQLRTRVNLESRCSKVTDSCIVESIYGAYQLSCSTSNISRTTSVYNYALSVDCLFQEHSAFSSWSLVSSTTIKYSTSNFSPVWCVCIVKSPPASSNSAIYINTNTQYGTCHLTVTRCRSDVYY